MLYQFYNNKLIHQFYEITHAERWQMTLHLIIFASKGPHSEIKHSIMQNHPLNLKCPQSLLLKKRYGIFPSTSQMLVKLVNGCWIPKFHKGVKKVQALRAGSPSLTSLTR